MKVNNGWFYFRKTDNGNLTGEYGNEHSNNIHTECSEHLNGQCDFGDGLTAWTAKFRSALMENGKSVGSDLEINRNGRIFNLTWSNGARFKGQGALCNGTLVGHYNTA